MSAAIVVEPPPLSLYIHFPWCLHKCPYCDFNSHAVDQYGFNDKAYVALLLKDLDMALSSLSQRSIKSIFIGGGTPSLISAGALIQLLEGINERCSVPLTSPVEVTLEANPGTVNPINLDQFSQAGITRISLGVQSFSDKHLKLLGRLHSAYEARHAIDEALSRFKKVNIDLMYALPCQSLKEGLSDLETAISCGVGHISTYQLTLEPNTLFGCYPPSGLPSHDAIFRMELSLAKRLHGADFEHYEVSAFAKVGQACSHNMNYWSFGDYLGIGAGAHSKLTLGSKVYRIMRYKNPKTYAEGIAKNHPIQTAVDIPPSSMALEFMMNALRLTRGFHPSLFFERTGQELKGIKKSLDEAQERQLLSVASNVIKPTRLGRRFLNDLLLLFV